MIMGSILDGSEKQRNSVEKQRSFGNMMAAVGCERAEITETKKIVPSKSFKK